MESMKATGEAIARTLFWSVKGEYDGTDTFV